MLRKILKWTGYVLFAVVCYALFLFYTFPLDLVMDKVLAQAQQQGYQVSINSSSTTLLPPGVSFEGIKVRHVDWGEETPPLAIEGLSLSGALWTLNSDAPAASFDLEIAKGDISGDFSYAKATQDLNLDLDLSDLDLKLMPFFDRIPLPLSGVMDGAIDFTWNLHNPAKAHGEIDIAIEKAVLGPAEQPLKVPAVRLGTFKISMAAENGVLRVVDWGGQGEDASLEAVGTVRLNQDFSGVRPNLTYRFKLGDLIQQDPTIATLLTIARSGQAQDGYYYYKLAGTMKSPSFLPSKNSARVWEQEKKRSKTEAKPPAQKSEPRQPKARETKRK